MGQNQSPDGGQPREQSLSEKEELQQLERIEGLQVVRLLPNSVAHRGGLVPYFDIIVGVDGKRFVDIISNADVIESLEKQGGGGSLEFRYFRDFLATHQGQHVRFDIFNLRIRHTRQVELALAQTPTSGGLLGCSIEWSRAVDVISRCWHVVDVLPNTPVARCADIRPGADYILGMQQPQEQIITLLHDERDFYQRMELWQTLQRTALFQSQRTASGPQANSDGTHTRTSGPVIPHNILLLLYNAEENAVKEVMVEMGTRPGTPLGLSLATGAIHWIPALHTTDLSQLPVMNQFCLTSTPSFETSYHELPSTNGAHSAMTGARSGTTSAATPSATAASPSTAPPSSAAVARMNPFRREGVAGDLPAYPPPAPAPAEADATAQYPATFTDRSPAQKSLGDSSTPSPTYASLAPHSEAAMCSPPYTVATAEPSFAGPDQLMGAFPKAGEEVYLGSLDAIESAFAQPQQQGTYPNPHRDEPTGSLSPSTVKVTQSDARTQPTGYFVPPPPLPQSHQAEVLAHPSKTTTHSDAVHQYPSPSQLGVTVTTVQPTQPYVPQRPQPSPQEHRTETAQQAPVPQVGAPQAAPAVPAAARHPPLPPHVLAASAALTAPAGPLATTTNATASSSILSPPHPPATMTKTFLQAVPRPPINFDLFGDGTTKA